MKRLLSLVVVAWSITSCSSQPAAVDLRLDRGPADRTLADRLPVDARRDATPPDAPRPEARPSDARPPDQPPPSCTYDVIDEKLVLCLGVYRYIERYQLGSGPNSCAPGYWTVQGTPGQHPNPTDAAAAAGCDATCIWSKATSVTLIHCGHKTGYIEFQAPACPAVLQYSDGYYPSPAAYSAAHPCLDGGAG
jgi:hypothetical protein